MPDTTNPAEDYTAALESAALFDLSDRGKIEVAGPDAVGFLHNLCTNDVKQLTPGVGCEAFLTTGQAKIISYVFIYRTGPQTLWLDAAPGEAANLVRHLEHFHITEQLEIIDRTSELVQLHLVGPEATSILRHLVPAELPELGDLQLGEATIAGITCQVRRHQPLGIAGYDILTTRPNGESVRQAISGAGAAPGSREVYQVLRVEAGTPEYGVDIDESNLPQEVGRTDQAVSFTKGCYIGQETVARIRTYGHVNRSLTALRLSENRAVPSGSKVFHEGKEVGQITSSVASPRLETGIALAYLRRGSSEPGTKVEVDSGGIRVGAEVVGLPFVR